MNHCLVNLYNYRYSLRLNDGPPKCHRVYHIIIYDNLSFSYSFLKPQALKLCYSATLNVLCNSIDVLYKFSWGQMLSSQIFHWFCIYFQKDVLRNLRICMVESCGIWTIVLSMYQTFENIVNIVKIISGQNGPN